jgi:hypothetical protein
MDSCSHSVEEDGTHSARSSSTGILSEAPIVRHEKAKQRNQQMAQKHKQIIETMQGVISLVVASGRSKEQDYTQQQVLLVYTALLHHHTHDVGNDFWVWLNNRTG